MATAEPHPSSADLAALDLAGLDAALREREVTSATVVARLRERIDALDSSGPGLASVLALTADAFDQAGQRDAERSAGRLRGPLHGIPVLVKDNIEAVGLPGSAGSLALAGRVVDSDAPLVRRLREAGAVILGATNLSEWANFRSPHSSSGWSALGGLTGNPWALDRSAGGSSSGSGAAVAAGLAPVAIGTETNGSITCPAALNGVVGLKPTVGTVSTRQVVPISASQDVPGPLARCVSDAAMVFEVLSGRDDCTATLRDGSASALRVGVADAWMSGHPAADALALAAISALEGYIRSVQPLTVPGIADDVIEDQIAVLIAEMHDDLGAYLGARPGDGVRTIDEVVAFNRAHADVELAYFGQEFLEASAASPGRSGDDYRQARARNLAFAREECLGPAYEQVDVIVAPAYQPAWKSDLLLGDQVGGGGLICTPPAILGWPILTVPIGLVDGLPVGLAITGPARSEPALLAVGWALERALALVGSDAWRPAWRSPHRG